MKHSNKKIVVLVEKMLALLGENPTREGLKGTPDRVAKSFEKFCEGYKKDPRAFLTVFDNEGYDEMVIARAIDFYSLCEHHLLPFCGKASIGYVPDKTIIGISKLPRLVELYARRLQNQERLTKQVAEALTTTLHPKGVGIVIQAEHFCMKMRGVEKQNCIVSTSSFTGIFKSDPRTRDEFLHLITLSS